MFPSVMRTLRTEMGRAVLLSKLREHTLGTQATMEPAQFDMLATLLNAVLAAASRSPDRQRDDELGIAAALIPLACSFCRVRYTYTYTPIRYTHTYTPSPYSRVDYTDYSARVRALFYYVRASCLCSCDRANARRRQQFCSPHPNSTCARDCRAAVTATGTDFIRVPL